jgi:hypothetical protein
MKIHEIKISQLKPADYNPRIITKKEFKGLINSLKTFGLVEPIVINKDYTVIGGHQRLKAWQSLGHDTISCYIVDLDKRQEKKLNVVLNSDKISGKYDEIKLAEILEELRLDNDFEELNLIDLQQLDLSKESTELDITNLENQEFTILFKYKEEEYLNVLDALNKYRDKNNFKTNEEALKKLLNV